MKKFVEVQFDEEAYEKYCALQRAVQEGKKPRGKPTYEQLLHSIENALHNIKKDPHFGNLVPRKYLSKKIGALYGTEKIFRVELVGYWRLLYTLIGEETRIIAFVLEYMDHERYNKVFGYRKK